MVAGLAFSADGKRLFVASAAAQSVVTFDLSGNRTDIACNCSPTELTPMGNLFRLNELRRRSAMAGRRRGRAGRAWFSCPHSGPHSSVRYLLVLAGGGAGSLARYAAGMAIVERFGSRFPIGTMTINITGSFLIGLVMTLITERLPGDLNLAPAAGDRLSGRLHDIFQLRVGDLRQHPPRRLLDWHGQRRRQRRLRLCRRVAGRRAGAQISLVIERSTG